MRAGLDRNTGCPLTGWAHCVQSIAFILTTEIGDLVMLRQFGSPALQLQDANATATTIMEVYVGVATALALWEPGFRLREIRLQRGGADGRFEFVLNGDFFPNGHENDFSVVEQRSAMFAANDNGFVAVQEAA